MKLSLTWDHVYLDSNITLSSPYTDMYLVLMNRRGDRLLISREVPDGWTIVGVFTSWANAYDYAVQLADDTGQIVEWFLEDLDAQGT